MLKKSYKFRLLTIIYRLNRSNKITKYPYIIFILKMKRNNYNLQTTSTNTTLVSAQRQCTRKPVSRRSPRSDNEVGLIGTAA